MACLLCFLAISTGCGKETDSSQIETDEDKKIEIGLTFDSLIIERWERDRDVFVSRARELGANVNIQNANGDVDEQISQIEYFIDKKVDAIVIVPVDCGALSDVIGKAKKAGIYVISYDRLIAEADTDLYVSFDNVMVGNLMAEAIASQIGNHGNVMMINGPLTDTNVPAVMKGFYDVIDKTNINIIEIDYADGWKAELAFDYASEYLTKKSPLVPDAIMCGNDSLAGQAIKALSERRVAGKVIVTGQDADLDACQRIVEGTQYMTVYKPVEKLAQRAAELTIELINNGAITTTDIIDDGQYSIPYEKLEPIAVTSQNMDEVITGAFHQKSEVYLNVDK